MGALSRRRGARRPPACRPASLIRPVDCVFPPRRVSNVISHFDEFFHFSPRGEKGPERDFKNRRRVDMTVPRRGSGDDRINLYTLNIPNRVPDPSTAGFRLRPTIRVWLSRQRRESNSPPKRHSLYCDAAAPPPHFLGHQSPLTDLIAATHAARARTNSPLPLFVSICKVAADSKLTATD